CSAGIFSLGARPTNSAMIWSLLSRVSTAPAINSVAAAAHNAQETFTSIGARTGSRGSPGRRGDGEYPSTRRRSSSAPGVLISWCSSAGSIVEPAGGLGRPVGEQHVGARAANGGEHLEDRGLAVHPAVGR